MKCLSYWFGIGAASWANSSKYSSHSLCLSRLRKEKCRQLLLEEGQKEDLGYFWAHLITGNLRISVRFQIGKAFVSGRVWRNEGVLRGLEGFYKVAKAPHPFPAGCRSLLGLTLSVGLQENTQSQRNFLKGLRGDWVQALLSRTDSQGEERSLHDGLDGSWGWTGNNQHHAAWIKPL